MNIKNLENFNIPTVHIVEILNPPFTTVDLQYPKVKQNNSNLQLESTMLLQKPNIGKYTDEISFIMITIWK